MNRYRKHILFAEDDGAGASAGASPVPASAAAPDTNPWSDGQAIGDHVDAGAGGTPAAPVVPATGAQAPAAQTPAPAATPSGEWTPEKIQQIIAASAQAGASAATQQPAAQAPVAMDPAEVDRITNAFKPTPEHIAALLEGGESSVQAMNEIVQGAVKHATTIAWLQTQMMQREMLSQMNPVLTAHQEQQANALRDEFFVAHPDLKAQTKLLAAVKAGLDQEGAFQGKSKAEAFALISSRAKEVLLATGAPNVPPAGGTPLPPAGMATLSRGSQHGAAAPAGATGGASPTTAKSIFG